MIIPTTLTTAPSVEPVTLDEMKTHLRGIDHSDHDDLLNGLIKSARQRIEKILGRALVEQTRTAYYKHWPATVIDLPNPVQSVDSIKYTDVDDSEETFSADNYKVDTASEPGRIVLGYNKVWPSVTLHHAEYPIEIQYVCGYEPDDSSPPDYTINIPSPILTAIKLDVDLKYNMPPEKLAEYTENAIESLLMPYKGWRF